MNRVKSLSVGCLAFCLALFLAASPALAKKPKTVWKTGTLAPKGVGYANQVRDIVVPAVRNATEGDVELKIYWGGVMGDDEQHLKKMRVGQLHAAGLSGQGTFLMTSELAVLGLPFLFNDFQEVDYLKNKTIDTFDQIVAKQGFRLLVWLDQDFDQIYSVKNPMQKVADFPQARFVTWFGPLEGKLLEALGTTPSPIGVTEIPSSLRSGVVNAMIAPSIWVVGTQLYSTFRYVNPMRIRYVPAFCVCTVKAWDQLLPKYQQNILDNREAWALEFTQGARKEGDKCLSAMLQYGLKEASSTPRQIQEIKERTTKVWDQLAGELYPRSLLDEIQEVLKQYRETKN